MSTAPGSRAGRAPVRAIFSGPLLNRLAASVLSGATLACPARAYDLQYRQNGTSFSAGELRRICNDALPAAYDQGFPEQRWSTYLLLDAHADQALGVCLSNRNRASPKSFA